MTTITKTTAQAVSRKLASMGYQRVSEDGTGFLVYETDALIGYGTEITVSHYGFPRDGYSNIVEDLIAAGYAVEVVIDNRQHQNFIVNALVVFGKFDL